MRKVIGLLIFLSALIVTNLSADEMFQAVDPKDATLVKTDYSKEFCNVCGMHLTKFYKTSHATEFKNGHKEQYCSLHCQAQIEEDHADGKDSDNYNEEIHQTRYKDLEYEYIDEFGNSHIKYVTIYINSNNNGEITSITE